MGSRTIAHRFYVMDTEAFDFVLGTDFFVQHSQIQSLTLQVPYLLYVDHGNGRKSAPLEQSEYTSSYLRVSKEEPSNMMAASETEDYQLLGEVLDQGLGELGYSREDLSVDLFASDKQHVLDLYCSKGKTAGTTLRAHLDQVPLNYPSETVVQPSSTAHFHYGFPKVEPLSRYSNKTLSSNLKTAIFQPCKRCHTP